MHEKGRIRYLHLVRHGQYRSQPEVFGGVLTDIGRTQATFLARYLVSLSIDRIHVSDLNRAIETAHIIAQNLHGVPVVQDSLLREVVPTPVGVRRVARKVLNSSRERLGKIEERYLRRTNRRRHELFVCHGNLIRSLVTRMLGAPARAWLKLDVHHCGVTTLKVRYDRSVRLVRFNDVGHLPDDLILQS